MIIWITIIAAGFLTYVTRLSFILLYGQIRMPSLMERALRFVPTAVLTAFFFPELLLVDGIPFISICNARLLAGILAIVVAWRTKNVIYTIVIGMFTLWVLQYLLG